MTEYSLTLFRTIKDILGDIKINDDVSLNYIENIIITRFNKCYEYLIKEYNNTKLVRQIIKNNENIIIYTSKNLTTVYKNNYLALLYINFLIEYELFLISHIKKYYYESSIDHKKRDMVNSNSGLSIKSLNKLMLKNFDKSLNIFNFKWTDLKAVWNNDGKPEPYKSDKPTNNMRVYTNELEKIYTDVIYMVEKFLFSINDIVEIILNKFLEKICEKLIKDNTEEKKNKLLNCIFSDISMLPGINTDLIYDNWIEKIVDLFFLELDDINGIRHELDIITFGFDKNSFYNHIYDIIIDTISNTFDDIFSTDIPYLADCTGLFSTIFIKNYLLNKNIKKLPKYFASCISYTIIEQYILYILYFTPDDIEIGTEEEISVKKLNPRHVVWNNIQKIGNENPSHWISIIKNKFTSEKKLLRSMLDSTTDSISNKKYNMINNRKTYFKTIVYTIFDTEISYINYNANIIGQEKLNIYNRFYNEVFNKINILISKIYNEVSMENISENINQIEVNKLIDNTYNNNKLIMNIINNEQNTLNTSPYNLIINTDSENVDKNEWLKSITTDFINKYFFSFDITTSKFMNLINKIFIDGINTYIDNHPIYSKIKQNDLQKGNFNYENYIKFIFKGGNIMAFVVYSLIKQFPNNTRLILEESFKKTFKKSDSDFSIIIKDITNIKDIREQDMDKIYNDITDLSYLLLNRFRNIMLSDIQNYCSFYAYSKSIRQKLIDNKILNVINKTQNQDRSDEYKDKKFIYVEYDNINNDIFIINKKSGIEIIKESKLEKEDNEIAKKSKKSNTDNYNDFGTNYDRNTRRDFKIEAVLKDNKTNIKLSYLNYLSEAPDLYQSIEEEVKLENMVFLNSSNETNFYITHNTSINKDSKNKINQFHLVRMKVNMKTKYTESENKHKQVNIPGEFIDISIPHYKANNKYFEPDYIQKYKMIIDDENSYEFNAYSFKIFFKDLISSLFDNKRNEVDDLFDKKSDNNLYKIDMPWYNKKMNKRIERILLFITIDIAKNTKNDVSVDKKISNIKYESILKTIYYLFNDLSKICNNILDIKSELELDKKINLLEKYNKELIALSKHEFTFISKGNFEFDLVKKNDYLIFYFIKNILNELNDTFISLIKLKKSNELDTINIEYYFKENKNFTHFKNSSNEDLFSLLLSFYDKIYKYITENIIKFIINLTDDTKLIVNDIYEFQPIVL